MPCTLAFLQKSAAKRAALLIGAGAILFAGCADHHDYYPPRHRTVTHHRDVVHDVTPSYSDHGDGYHGDTSHHDEDDY